MGDCKRCEFKSTVVKCEVSIWPEVGSAFMKKLEHTARATTSPQQQYVSPS